MNTNKVLLLIWFIQFTLIANAQYQITVNEKGTWIYLNPVFPGQQ
jgi:hypothetical protein